jgi:hypothetical protein
MQQFYITLLIVATLLLSCSLISKRIFLYTSGSIITIINITYIIFWSELLHCTQRTNFWLAYVDFHRHAEEIQCPLVYHPVLGVIIRFIYGIILLFICFLPAFLLLRDTKNFTFKKNITLWISLAVISLIAVYIPNYIIGERISAFVGTVLFINILLFLLVFIFYWLQIKMQELKDRKK